jgi:predicted component of type VI protein secretion system
MATKTPSKAASKPAPKSAPKAAPTAAAKPRTAAPARRPAAKPLAKPVKAAAPLAKPAAPAKPVKPPKAKLVRDSFTMPQSDFALIAALKDRALGFKRPTKKSELLRAGLQALAGLNDGALQTALNALAPLKPGRPKKGD